MLLYICITLWLLILLLIGLYQAPATFLEYNLRNLLNTSASRHRFTRMLCLLTFLFFWFLTAFRAENIGNDTVVYLNYFDIFSQGIDRTRTFELGYQYLNYFLSKLTTSHHVFLICIATIMYGGTVRYIFKYSKSIPVSLCLFFCYFFSLYNSMFRQGIAMVIALYGYQALKDGKKTIAALLFSLAVTFHTTAIVCFLLFFKPKMFKKQWVVLMITIISIILSGSGLLEKIVSLVAPRYMHYFESRYAASGWLAVSFTVISYIAWYYLISKALGEKPEDKLVAMNFTLMLIIAAFGFAVNLFTRAGEYFLLIAIVEIPNTLTNARVKHYKWWLLGLCILQLVMFILTLVFRPGWNHLYPYEFWR